MRSPAARSRCPRELGSSGRSCRDADGPPQHLSVWAQFTIKVDNRSEVAARLASAGVPTAGYYPRPMHLQPAFAAWGDGAGSLPISEKLARQVLSLPLDAYASDAEIDYVCEAVTKAVACN